MLIKLAEAFDVRPGERRMVATLMLLGFFIGLTYVFIQVPALALFVETFGSEGLPPLYIAVAFISTFVSYIYLKIGDRVPFATLLILNFAFIIAGTVGLRYLLGSVAETWPLFFLPIWFEVVTTIGWIGFGTLQNRLFEVRQARRLFGVIRMMVPGANIIGGLTISLLARVVETPNLFVLSALNATIALLILTLIVLRTYGGRLREQEAQETANKLATKKLVAKQAANRNMAKGEVQARGSLRRRYVLLIFVLICVWWVAFYFVDNIFYDLLEEEFPTRQDIASFLGVFFGVVQGSLLLIGNLFTSRIINFIGMRTSALIMPIIVTLCIIGLIAAETFGAALTLLFVAGAAAKLANGAIGFSVDTNARNLLYQPLPPEERSRIQTIGQGIVEPLSIGFVGFILLALTRGYGLGALELAYIFVGIAGLWLVTVVITFHEYPLALRAAIARRRLGEGQFEIKDSASIRLLRQELNSPYPEAVIYALSLLETADRAYLITALPGLLDHPAPEVRQAALERIEAMQLTSALDRVRAQITTENPPRVVQVALSALVALGGESVFPAVAVYLEHPNRDIQRGAIIGLLRHGGVQGRQTAMDKLRALGESVAPADRLLVAEVIQVAGDTGFLELLYPLLYDETLNVRRAAILAAGTVKDPDLWLDVMAFLKMPGVRTEAAQALVLGGETALDEIRDTFIQDNQSRDLLIRLARVCGRIGGPAMITFLAEQMNHPDEEVRTQVLASLATGGYQPTDPAINDQVQAQIRVEAEQMTHSLALYADLVDDPTVVLLAGAVYSDIQQTQDRLFYLMTFIYGQRAMLQARDALLHGTVERKAYALEVLDNTLSRPLRAFIIPLLDTIDVARRLDQLQTTFPHKRLLPGQHLQHFITATNLQNPWLKLYALYAAHLRADATLVDPIIDAVKSTDPLVSETARWSLVNIDPVAYQRVIEFMGLPDSPFLRDTDKSGDKIMYAVIEKVVILKTISIFVETPSDVLVDVAGLMDVVEVKKDEVIFHKNDPGNSMYVIVAGEVRVHDGDVTLNTLRDRDVFGELALLDPEPRAASVTATQDTVLFRLDQAPFFELIADRGEVARGIMRVLVRTIRASARDLSRSWQVGRSDADKA